MTRSVLGSLLAGGLVLVAGACGDDEGGEAGPDATPSIDGKLSDTVDASTPLADTCSTSIAAGTGGDYTELCAVEGTVEHVRIADFAVDGPHFSTQVFFGFDAPPTDPQAELAADQFKLLFYSGMGALVPAIIQPVFGTASGEVAGDATFVRSTATVCFDVVDSTATTAPVFNLWVDGVNGADCETASTLTADSVFSSIADWGGTVGAVAKEKKVYFYQRSDTAAPTITVFDDAVLPEGAGPVDPPAPLSSCETPVAAGTASAFTELCSIDGSVEHVRLAGISNEVAHYSTQVFFGFDAPPTSTQGELAADQFKLLFYSGMGNIVPPFVQPVFGTASGEVAGDAAFVRSTATVCFDVVDSTAESAPVFNLWVDGVNGADCEIASTLTAGSVLASIVDWGGAVGPIAKDKKIYFYQRTAAAAPTVTLFDEPVLPEGAPTEPPAPLSCETAITAGTASAYTELCSFEGTVEHVRLAGIVNEVAHYSTQVLFGFDAPPTSTQGELAADHFKLLFYSGMGNIVPPIVQPVFGTASGEVAGNAAFVRTTSTVCFDLVDSTATTAPAFTLWVDGVNGADCETASTLTVDAAFASIDSWGGAVGAITKDKKVYFYQRSAAGAPTITLFDDPVL
jgi:hypothetical protein